MYPCYNISVRRHATKCVVGTPLRHKGNTVSICSAKTSLAVGRQNPINQYTFNSNKTLCIKSGEPVYSDDVAWINGCIIKWVDNVRHLGNYVSKDLRDDYDCKMKCSAFINSVNKLLANRHRADQRYPSKPT